MDTLKRIHPKNLFFCQKNSYSRSEFVFLSFCRKSSTAEYRGGDKKKKEGQIALSLLLGGGYLLSHFRSTIGVVRLNFSVRNGKRWDPHAITTLVHLFSGPRGHRDIIKIIDRKRLAPHRPLRRVQAHKLESCRKDSARKASPSLFRLRFSATFQFLCKKAFGELVLLG